MEKPTQPKTAVEWLIDHLESQNIVISDQAKAEAIAREKDQTQSAFKMGKMFTYPNTTKTTDEKTTLNAPPSRDGLDSTSTV